MPSAAKSSNSSKRKPARFLRISVEEYRRQALENECGGIRDACVRLLRVENFVCSVTDSSLRICPRCGEKCAASVDPGWPDVTAISPWGDGRLWAVETKTDKGKLRPAQIRVLESLRAAGAVVIVPRSVDDLRREIEARRPRAA